MVAARRPANIDTNPGVRLSPLGTSANGEQGVTGSRFMAAYFTSLVRVIQKSRQICARLFSECLL